AVDHLGQADDRDRERRGQPEHDPERTPAPTGRARTQERGQHREHAWTDGGAGAGEQGEEREEDHGVRVNAERRKKDELGLNLFGMPLTVEIWSDVVCPWCYIGKRRFEAALEQFEHRDEVTVMWRSFELDPEAPQSYDVAPAERLAAKYGVTI